MDRETFEEIRQFALDKEIEAEELYSRMAAEAELPHVQELFEELAAEERKHQRMLENIKTEKVADADLASVQDLRLSDYLVEQEFRPDMSYQDVLILAMKREERSMELYRNLANQAAGELRRIFEFLAREETKHKERLQREYDEFILSEN